MTTLLTPQWIHDGYSQATNPLFRGLNIFLKMPLLRSGLHSHSSKAFQIYHNFLIQPGFNKTSLSEFNMTIYEAKPPTQQKSLSVTRRGVCLGGVLARPRPGPMGMGVGGRVLTQRLGPAEG